MKKTKNKKSAVALLRKRKRFGGLFLRRWIIVLIISAFVWIAAKDKFINEAFNTEKTNYNFAKNSILDTIHKGPQNESDVFYYNRISFSMAQRQETGTVSVLYNAETGEVIADCDEQIFLLEKREGDGALIYACPTKDIEGWDEFSENRVKYKDSYDSVFERIEIDHIYVNEAGFVPGELIVNVKGAAEGSEQSKTIFSKVFGEPKNLESEYIKTELTDDWSRSFICGYSDNDLSPYVWNDSGYAALQSWYQRSVENGNSIGAGEGYYGDYEIHFRDEYTIILPTGEKAVLLTVRYYDAWAEYGTGFIIAAVITFVAGLVLALIWTRLAYIKLKAQYDMEDYRNTLMNTMAHDLKSPLMSISGYAENLQNNINSDKREYYAEAILGNIKYMNRIIESVLTLGKTENEKIVLKKEKCNVAKLVNECDKKYDLQKKEKNLKLIIEGDVELNIDTSLFVQAIDNLIGNAVKYASDNSTINVVINEMAMSVTNNCDKMPEVDTDTLCEAFVVGNENRSNRSGSGLGLAIVKNICTLHRYGFEVKCENNEFVAKIVLSKKRH